MFDPTTLTYGRVTSLKAGTCNNVDFLVLYLAYHGTSKAGVVGKAHSLWRGKPSSWRYLSRYVFSRQFGYVSHDFFNGRSAIRPPCYGFGSQHGTLIHNPGWGLYALNANGCFRLARIMLTA